jgi:F-type H+-transporting ATPase subunit b
MSMLAVSTTSSFLAASEGGGVNVDLDASLVVQIGLFVVLLVVLKPLLFDPMLKLFEEREKRTEGIIKTVGAMDEKSARALAKYEAVLAKAREAGSAERDVLRREAQKKEAERMAEIREVAARTVDQGRAQIASEAKAARTALTTEATSLGRTIAARVLGRQVST